MALGCDVNQNVSEIHFQQIHLSWFIQKLRIGSDTSPFLRGYTALWFLGKGHRHDAPFISVVPQQLQGQHLIDGFSRGYPIGTKFLHDYQGITHLERGMSAAKPLSPRVRWVVRTKLGL